MSGRIFSTFFLSALSSFLLSPSVLSAGVLNITQDSAYTLPSGGTLYFTFNLSPSIGTPESLSFNILGMGANALSAPLPGTTQQAYAGYSLTAGLLSASGMPSMPLVSPYQSAAGLPDGSLIATPATDSAAAAAELALFNGSIALNQQQAAALLGFGGAGTLAIRNNGPAVVFGTGLGANLKSALQVSAEGKNGFFGGGVTSNVYVATPEPGTVFAPVMGAALLLLFWRRARTNHLRRN